MSKSSSGPSAGMADVRDEQQAVALLTVDLDCSQQKFFQAEYGRHRRSPTAALLLCLLLGNFGAHEFYFGRMTSGLLRLLFSWTFIPWLIALVEAPHVPAFARRYNAELAQGIVDMLHEVRAHVRALDPPTAPVLGAATVVVAPTVAPIVLRPDDEHLSRAANDNAPADTGTGAPHIPYAALMGGGSLAAISAVAAEAVGYHRASDHTAQAAAPTPDATADDHASAPPAPPAPPAPMATAWDDTPVEQAAPPEHATGDTAIAAAAAVPVFAYSMGTARRAPVRYGPPLDEAADEAADEVADADAQAPSAQQPMPPAPPVRMRRIVVRKVALVDGKLAAEAIATREVALEDPTSPLSLDERIQRATEDARDEALRLLAERVSDDVRADAAQQFGDYA